MLNVPTTIITSTVDLIVALIERGMVIDPEGFRNR